MSKENFSKSLQRILKEMCKVVKADYNTFDFDKDRWYIEYKWTINQQDKFKKWLSDLLYSNRDVRNEIMEHPIKNKKYCDKVAVEFVFNYGWMIKE